MISPTSINVSTLHPNFGVATVSSSPVEGSTFQDLLLKSMQATSVEPKTQIPEADLAPQMLLQLRDQLMDAYDQISHMQF